MQRLRMDIDALPETRRYAQEHAGYVYEAGDAEAGGRSLGLLSYVGGRNKETCAAVVAHLLETHLASCAGLTDQSRTGAACCVRSLRMRM
jgi:hypothetical protein